MKAIRVMTSQALHNLSGMDLGSRCVLKGKEDMIPFPSEEEG